MKSKISSRGFTLIELLVVIAIIGILASVVLVSLSSARNKGKDSRVISDVQQVRTEAEAKFNGSNYSVALVASNSTKSGISNGAVGQGMQSAIAIQLRDDARANGGELFAITNAGPTAYAIYGALPSTSSSQKYFCLGSDGSSAPSTSNVYADSAAFITRIATAGNAICY